MCSQPLCRRRLQAPWFVPPVTAAEKRSTQLQLHDPCQEHLSYYDPLFNLRPLPSSVLFICEELRCRFFPFLLGGWGFCILPADSASPLHALIHSYPALCSAQQRETSVSHSRCTPRHVPERLTCGASPFFPFTRPGSSSDLWHTAVPGPYLSSQPGGCAVTGISCLFAGFLAAAPILLNEFMRALLGGFSKICQPRAVLSHCFS